MTLGVVSVPAVESPARPEKPLEATKIQNLMTLDALVSEVLENNPELNFFKAEIDAAKGLRRTAGTWANPEISGALGQKKVWNEERELTGKGKAGEISITQTFEWPGRMGLRRAIADRDIHLAELGLEQFKTSLAARTRIKAYELFAAREIAAASVEVASHFRALREVLVQRDPAGLTPLLETRVIEAMELNMQRKASQATLVAQATLFDLNQLRGKPVGEEISLSPRRLMFAALEDKNALIELARSNDFLVRMRALELEKSGFQVGLAENERWPAISVGPSFAQEQAGERERVVGAAVSLPLPFWNQNQGSVQTARARRTQAEISLNAAQRDAERRLLEAAAIYEMKVREMASWGVDSIQHFQEAAELADRHYRLGAVPVSIYVELQTQYLEAIAGLHDTKKEALEAAAQLELLTGKQLSLASEENK